MNSIRKRLKPQSLSSTTDSLRWWPKKSWALSLQLGQRRILPKFASKGIGHSRTGSGRHLHDRITAQFAPPTTSAKPPATLTKAVTPLSKPVLCFIVFTKSTTLLEEGIMTWTLIIIIIAFTIITMGIVMIIGKEKNFAIACGINFVLIGIAIILLCEGIKSLPITTINDTPTITITDPNNE